jgi:hypothetical protein
VALTVAEHNRNAVRATCSACGAYIRWVKTRPPAERQASRKRGIDAWMASQPASEKQLQFLRTLGHDRAPANKFEASQLIDALLGKGAAS